MHNNNQEKITYENLGGGAARELVERAIDDVLQNISDKNKDQTATRKIILTAEFKPDKSGAIIAISVDVATKLAGTIGHETVAWIDHDKGVLQLMQKPANQLSLYGSEVITEQ